MLVRVVWVRASGGSVGSGTQWAQGTSPSGVCPGQICLDPISLPSLQMFLVIGKNVPGSSDTDRGLVTLLRWLFKESPEWWFVIIYFYQRYLATSGSRVGGCGDGAILLQGVLLEGSTALCPPAKGWVSLLCMEMICLEHLWWRRYAEPDLQL